MAVCLGWRSGRIVDTPLGLRVEAHRGTARHRIAVDCRVARTSRWPLGGIDSIQATQDRALGPRCSRISGSSGVSKRVSQSGATLPALAVLVAVAFAPVQADGQDLRAAHQAAVTHLVRIESTGGAGSGWIADINGHSLILTNHHVVDGASRVRLTYYAPRTRAWGRVVYVSRSIDLAAILPEGPTPVRGLTWASGDLVRGERVVLAGHPRPLSFITSEGVVAGSDSGTRETDLACGAGRNCVVIDADGEAGSSGGPVVDSRGRVIGMLWGGVPGTSFSLCIHTDVLNDELVLIQHALPPESPTPPPRRGP